MHTKGLMRLSERVGSGCALLLLIERNKQGDDFISDCVSDCIQSHVHRVMSVCGTGWRGGLVTVHVRFTF